MLKNKSYIYPLQASTSPNTSISRVEDFDETETGTLEIIGTGEIRVRNTGGSSASEGGMGSDSDDKAKGDLTKPDTGKNGNNSASEDEDISFDPIKKNVREAEKQQNKD